MKVCITSKGEETNAQVDPRFGRCAYFCFYDTETGEFTFEQNTFTHARGGVGVQASQHMVNQEVSAVITGQIGPNAYQALEAGGIRMYTGAKGTVADTVEQFNRGEFESANGPTNEGHMYE